MLILPYGDLPNDPKRVAWMNYALIGLNAAVFLMVLSRGAEGYASLVEKWGYNPADPSVTTLFTSLFMHADIWHLGGNMLFLWIFGDNVEARLGSVGYLIAYLALGAVATLTFGAFNAGLDMPLIGASGAISGVQGLYWIACPRHKVKVFVWLFIIIVTWFKVNARLVMVFWFFMQDVFPIMVGRGPTGDNVAHLAHLGGFAGGIVLMLVLRPLVGRIQQAADDELGHTGRYRSARSSSRAYEHRRRRNPYGSKLSKTRPALPVATDKPTSPLRPPPLPPREKDS